MNAYIEPAIILPVLAVCYQMYSYAMNSKGRERQGRCQMLGILFMTLGVCALVYRSVATVFLGLALMMFGFRLLARGLDRLDKSIFIDRYDDDSK